MSSKRDYASIANKYARDVISGKILACKWVILACKRHFRDLERSRRGDFPYVFDVERGAKACRFAEGFRHPKDFFDGTMADLIVLEPWQIFERMSLFGWVWRSDSSRYRFKRAYISVARKNAKSTEAAITGLYKFVAEGQGGAEVYFGAATKEQALDVGLTPALTMAESAPDFCERFGLKINKNSIKKQGDRPAIMKVIIGKPRDGQAPFCAIIDEYHEHATDTQYQAMKTGMGSRKNALLLVITTAGYDIEGPCRKLQDECEQILDEILENDELFILIYTLDEKDDWTDLKVAFKSNPNLGVSVDLSYLAAQIRDAQNSPIEQGKVKTKNLNIWVNGAMPWIRSEDWAACLDPNMLLENFVGQPCVPGLDLADLIDLSSEVKTFKVLIDDAVHYFLFGRHWLNEARIKQKVNDHYRRWVDQGFLIETPGNTTSYPEIKRCLLEDAKQFLIGELAHDPHHAGPLLQFLQEDEEWDQSIVPAEIEQNFKNYSPAMKEFEKAVLERRIHHNGDPVLAWCVANTVARPVGRDNVVPDKKRNSLKIDAAVAALMAFMRAGFAEAQETKAGLDFLNDDDD